MSVPRQRPNKFPTVARCMALALAVRGYPKFEWSCLESQNLHLVLNVWLHLVNSWHGVNSLGAPSRLVMRS